jgi:Putative auto-transporter adhesin, head GIN domain
MTKSYVLLGWLAAVWLTGCDDSGVEGNGQRTSELRDVGSFSRIRSDAELDIETVQGEVAEVTVSIDSNLQGLVKTRVSDDTLYIDTRENIDDTVDGPHVRVTVPVLTAAKLAGSGRMAFWLDQPETPLDLYLSGSGAMRFEGSAVAVGAYLSGSGSIRLLGQTRDLDVELSGSGSVRASELSADSASIELSGSGDISASVSQSVSVSLSGSGDVDLWGDASLDGYASTGSGDVHRH